MHRVGKWFVNGLFSEHICYVLNKGNFNTVDFLIPGININKNLVYFKRVKAATKYFGTIKKKVRCLLLN